MIEDMAPGSQAYGSFRPLYRRYYFGIIENKLETTV